MTILKQAGLALGLVLLSIPAFAVNPTLTAGPAATATKTATPVPTPNRTVTPSRENGTHFTNLDLDNHTTLLKAEDALVKPGTCKMFVAAGHVYLSCQDGTIELMTDGITYP
jgi:hypothetical protein